ncbi:MAG: 2-phospho-L-lactate transferase, partial [Chloroflexota bacterium]
EHLGLSISPDLDTVCYPLAGLANPETGWGRLDETWQAFENLATLGGPDWFRLGDQDLGTHLERTQRLKGGDPLSTITHDFCMAWGIGPRVLPMSDQAVPTIVHTDVGDLAFQDYFVARRCQPVVSGFEFAGLEDARPAPGVLAAIGEADAVIICPSNPWVSIAPILALPGVREALEKSNVVAISPIIGGQALKGPAAKMYTELGITPSAHAVAEHYGELLTGFILDDQDVKLTKLISSKTLVTDTIMLSTEDQLRLAKEILLFTQNL